MTKVSIGVLAYARFGNFQERVHFGIFWAVQRHYGHDVSNTTIIDWIQQGASQSRPCFELIHNCFVSFQWQCCGLNSYTSWSNSLYSKRHVPKETYPTNTFIVPKSCCVDPASDICETTHLKGLGSVSLPDIHEILHHDVQSE